MIAAILKLLSSWVTWLILVSAVAVFVFGYKPKPCPRHICFPHSEVVTVEQMIAADPDRYDPAKREERRRAAFERNRQASRDAGLDEKYLR